MTKYTLATIKKRAFGVGYRVEKGFQHYLYNGAFVTDYRGNRYRGYKVMNLSNGLYEWGSYNDLFDYLWTLEDVEKFLKSVYKAARLEY